MTVFCPISGSSEVTLLEKITTKSLIKAYQDSLDLDVFPELKEVVEIGFYHCQESDISFFYPMVTGSESFYEKLQKFDWYYQDEKEEYNYANNYIKASDTVLEIGCGKGAFSQKIKSLDYTGLEFSKQAVQFASELRLNILNESIEEHSIKNSEVYDVVCSFQVLEHVAMPKSFIKSCIQCLKPGGLLIYSIPSADSFVTFFNDILNLPPHHVTWYSDESLEYIGKLFELKVINIHHDPLTNVSRRRYKYYLMLRYLQKLIHYPSNSNLIDRSIRYKIITKIASVSAKLVPSLILNSEHELKPYGQSVTIVYEKPM
jgi:SAM-dependent methyltransferase